MSAKALRRESCDVSVGKASRTASGWVERMVWIEDRIEDGVRARSATARLPCLGEERMRAIPVP